MLIANKCKFLEIPQTELWIGNNSQQNLIDIAYIGRQITKMKPNTALSFLEINWYFERFYSWVIQIFLLMHSNLICNM